MSKKTTKNSKQSKALKEIAKLIPIKRLIKGSPGAIIETLPGRFAKVYLMDMSQDITSFVKSNPTRCSVEVFALSTPNTEEQIKAFSAEYRIPQAPQKMHHTAYYVVLSIKAPMDDAIKEFTAAEDILREVATPLSAKQTVNLLHNVYHPGNTKDVLTSEPEFSEKAGFVKLIETIAPDSLTSKLKEVQVNGVKTTTILLIDYSSELHPNFYTELAGLNRMFYLATHYEPVEIDGIIGWLESKIKADDEAAVPASKNPKSKSAKSTSTPTRLLSTEKRKNYETMLKKLHAAKNANERVYSVSTYISVFGEDEDELDDTVRLIRDKSKRFYMNFIDAQSQHKQAFNASLPIGVNKCEISSTIFADDYSKMMPNGKVQNIYNSGVYYATDIENEAPFVMDRSQLKVNRGLVLGTGESNKQAMLQREIEALRGKKDTAIIVLDIDNNMDTQGTYIDVTQAPLFPVHEAYGLKCTLLGNIVRALINKKAGLLKDESESLSRIFGELESVPDYTFSSFLGRTLVDEVLNRKITALLSDIPANCTVDFTPGSAEECVVYKFDKVESHNPLFSNRDIYGLCAIACAYEQALQNQQRGIKTHIYINGFDAGIFHVKNAKFLAALLNQENDKIVFTLATEHAGLILDGIKRNVKTDTIEMSSLVKSLVECEFVAIYNISPSYRQTIWTLLNLHPQYMQSIVAEHDAGIICTPHKVVPFNF